MFIVNTDEDLYTKIDTTCRQFRHLFLYFQNPDTEMSHEELERWHRDCSDMKIEIAKLLAECDDRIEFS
jgi:hypothetical protein